MPGMIPTEARKTLQDRADEIVRLARRMESALDSIQGQTVPQAHIEESPQRPGLGEQLDLAINLLNQQADHLERVVLDVGVI